MHRRLCFFLLVAVMSLTPPVRGDVFTYAANLSGQSESPPNNSNGTGSVLASYDNAAHTLALHIVFSGLDGNTTASHIHAATAIPGAGTAPVATQLPYFAGFPIGVMAGSYDHVFDTTQSAFYNPSFVTANGGTTASAETALFSAIAAGKAYLNIHSTVDPGGEIRGFLIPVPEPGVLALACVTGTGLLAQGLVRRRRAE